VSLPRFSISEWSVARDQSSETHLSEALPLIGIQELSLLITGH
jgi:hypothetical protein